MFIHIGLFGLNKVDFRGRGGEEVVLNDISSYLNQAPPSPSPIIYASQNQLMVISMENSRISKLSLVRVFVRILLGLYTRDGFRGR